MFGENTVLNAETCALIIKVKLSHYRIYQDIFIDPKNGYIAVWMFSRLLCKFSMHFFQ